MAPSTRDGIIGFLLMVAWSMGCSPPDSSLEGGGRVEHLQMLADQQKLRITALEEEVEELRVKLDRGRKERIQLENDLQLAKLGCDAPDLTPDLDPIPTPTLPASDPPPRSSTGSDLEVVSSAYKLTECNKRWCRFAWTVTLQSLVNRDLDVKIEIFFLDGEGFQIDETRAYGELAAQSTETYRGYTLLDHETRTQATRIYAEASGD